MLSHNHIMLLCLIIVRIMHGRVDFCKFSFEFFHGINDVCFLLYIHLREMRGIKHVLIIMDLKKEECSKDPVFIIQLGKHSVHFRI